MNFDLTPTICIVSIVPVTISDLFKGGKECDASMGKADASVEKVNRSVGKTNAFVGKVIVLLLKHSVPFLDEELFGPCPMVE